MPASPDDLDVLSRQLGRPVRGVRSVAARCASGHPCVVETEPRLPDGTPFPTLYYLTCPAAVAAVSTLESRGVMKEMTGRLDTDEELSADYRRAHLDYLSRRERIDHVVEIDGVSAGGMPLRVKCLHVLVAHSIATGSGTNPFGDEALQLMRPTWSQLACDWEG